ncbi:hypothetical protein [Sphingomonas gilva]|uniref:hypothetical protein n=1 Tax=Sphingomonas gilva TaxID=2305907 RepID=UPI0011C378B1|nr:hypothetical protein [Sphingomonas gilva]
MTIGTWSSIPGQNLAGGGMEFRTSGYATDGDGGGARYRVMTTLEAPEPGEATSADGIRLGLSYEQEINVKMFGAVGDGIADDWQSFEDAKNYFDVKLEKLNAYVDGDPLEPNLALGRLYIPGGVYRLAQPWQINKCAIEIYGDTGVQGSRRASILQGDGGYTVLYVQRADTDLDTKVPNTGKSGDATILRHITITMSSAADTDAHGIRLRARAHLEQVQTFGCGGDGINVVATSGSADFARHGNANLTHILWCKSTANRGCGLRIEGADVNASVVLGFDGQDNGSWGIYDDAFLNVSYLGCHTSNNGRSDVGAPGYTNTTTSWVQHDGYRWSLAAGQEALAASTEPGADDLVWIRGQAQAAPATGLPSWSDWVAAGKIFVSGGPYACLNDNSCSVFVGCYSEGAQPHSQLLAPRCQLIGGLHGSPVIGNYVGGASNAWKFDSVTAASVTASVRTTGAPVAVRAWNQGAAGSARGASLAFAADYKADGITPFDWAQITGVAASNSSPLTRSGRLIFSLWDKASSAILNTWLIDQETFQFRPATDNIHDLGAAATRIKSTYSVNFRPGPGIQTNTAGLGSPEGAITASPGSLYQRTDGSAGAGLYVKDSGTSLVGWRPMASYVSASSSFGGSSIAPAGTASTTIAVADADLGDIVDVSLGVSLQGLILSGYVSATDIVTVVLFNPTTATINLASTILRAVVWKTA